MHVHAHVSRRVRRPLSAPLNEGEQAVLNLLAEGTRQTDIRKQLEMPVWALTWIIRRLKRVLGHATTPELVLHWVETTGNGERKRADNPQPSLSERQKKMLELLCAGKVGKRIAHELGMTKETFSRHKRELFRIIGASNRMEAVLWWHGIQHEEKSGSPEHSKKRCP